MLLKAGYMGHIARYVAGETAPVVTDTFNYVAERGAPGIRAIKSALQDQSAPQANLSCASCGAEHDSDAQFCDRCGVALNTARTCVGCAAENDRDAKFCDSCGMKF